MSFETEIREIQQHLTMDLLQEPYITRIQVFHAHPHTGHCYVASEALFHLGAAEAGFRSMVLQTPMGTHWFLKHTVTGEILDPTALQFKKCPDYESAKGCGFSTKEPSARARTLLQRIGHERRERS